MPRATANGIEIEYDTFGDENDPALLLIAGFTVQMIFWDEPLCQKLADGGLYVIRFDNRDYGLSSKLEEAGIPDVMEAFQNKMQGKKIDAPYTFSDMANYVIGLMDALNIKKAHVCGMSMGASIAQVVAIENPHRVLSLISVYGSTGDPKLPRPKPEVQALFATPPGETREDFINQSLKLTKTTVGSGFRYDEDWHRNLAERAYDRSNYLAGAVRHLVAVLASDNRKPALSELDVPTLVVHGKEDPAAPVEGGIDTAETIPNAELLLIDGMGHDLPKLGGAWDQITDRIIEFTGRKGL